jgi:CRISPR-associated protein Cmr6
LKSATIPLAADVASLVGAAAERVENRSLLLDKFIFHKKWPQEQDDRGHDIKWDDASRWSFTRISDGAAELLLKDSAEKKRRASGNKVQDANRERLIAEAGIAATLASVNWDSKRLFTLRAEHTQRFVSLFRSAYGRHCTVTIGQLEGRLAINLADSLIQNAGISLDRLSGVPFIPGSAVKGVCRHVALSSVKAASESEQEDLFRQFRKVFGTSESEFKERGQLYEFKSLLKGAPEDIKGSVSFLPAYPINEARIVVDLTNVHYPQYYGNGSTKDLAEESPRPNPFPAVEMGAQFAFCLVLNDIQGDIQLLDCTRTWLEQALTVHGIGAKTAAGYGWFSLQPQVLQEIEAAEQRKREAAEAAAKALAQEEEQRLAEVRRKSELSPEALAAEALLNLSDEEFATFAKELAQKSEPEQRAFLGLLAGKAKRDRWKKWKKNKPEIVKVVDDVRTAINFPTLP